jgi:hypothetical protein
MYIYTYIYPESVGMEVESCERRSQDFVLGCENIVSLHEETGKRCSSPTFWLLSLPLQQHPNHSRNLHKPIN